MISQTHTYAELGISAAAYDEIAAKLKAAGYDQAFMKHDVVNGHATVDMLGIGVTRLPDPNENLPAVDKVLGAVRAIAVARGLDAEHGETADRAAVKLTGLAWAAAVRAEWQAFVDADPELKAQHAVAHELMREDGYGMDNEPVCLPPGTEPQVAMFEGRKAVCFNYSMGQAIPLSAIYVNKVRLVQSAAARVAKALAEEAIKQPVEWPITIASGESFNSIEEMEASSGHAVREMAAMMRADFAIGAKPAAAPSGGVTSCWAYFGFDGPVDLNKLYATHREMLTRIPVNGTDDANKLAAEAHRQYANCLKELGTAIMAGPDEDSE